MFSRIANNPLAIMAEAKRLVALHSTSLNYELDRMARELGHSDWEAMLAALPQVITDALALREEWLRPATEEDGDIGGWKRVPAFNPITDDILPGDPVDRDHRIAAIVNLLMWTPGILGNIIPGANPLATRLASAIIRQERATARNEGRQPTLVRCEQIFADWETRCQAIKKADRRTKDAWGILLRQLSSEHQATDAKSAEIFEELADIETGTRVKALSGTYYTFLRFRHPAIARLAA